MGASFDALLASFLEEHSYSGYYAEHGEAFALASRSMHAERLTSIGHSIINRHAARRRDPIFFRADLKPLSADQFYGRSAQPTVNENLTVGSTALAPEVSA